ILRVGFDRRFKVPIEYGVVRTVCDISTIANIDYRLARTERQCLPESANIFRVCGVYIVSLPAGRAVASLAPLEIQYYIALVAEAFPDRDRQSGKRPDYGNGTGAHIGGGARGLPKQVEQRRQKQGGFHCRPSSPSIGIAVF